MKKSKIEVTDMYYFKPYGFMFYLKYNKKTKKYKVEKIEKVGHEETKPEVLKQEA